MVTLRTVTLPFGVFVDPVVAVLADGEHPWLAVLVQAGHLYAHDLILTA